MTRKQLQTMQFIIDFINKNWRKPTHKEIQKKFGLKSPATVNERLSNLKKKLNKCPFCEHRI